MQLTRPSHDDHRLAEMVVDLKRGVLFVVLALAVLMNAIAVFAVIVARMITARHETQLRTCVYGQPFPFGAFSCTTRVLCAPS